MRRTVLHQTAVFAMTIAVIMSTFSAYADPAGNLQTQTAQAGFGIQEQTVQAGFGIQEQKGGHGMNFGAFGGESSFAEEPSEIVLSETENSAVSLTADEENAETIEMSDENSSVKITEAGTYIITGSCSDGSITVKKETAGVILILRDLTLSSSSGAPLSLGKGSEVKVIAEGSVTLTDAENPEDENSADADTADAFDGAVIKAKAGSSVCLTGSGNLTLDASSCKNGIKISSEDEEYGIPAFTIDGDLTISITAANDAVNSGYDLIISGGTLEISAGDDAIHADRILQIGTAGTEEEEADGPVIVISACNEGLEGSVVNILGGDITVNSSDDGINAANKDRTYSSELDYSINITGGNVLVNAGADGLDSNGNINVTGGFIIINAVYNGGEGGIDYQGACYIAEGTVENNGGVTMDSGSGGFGGGNGRMNQGFEGQTPDGKSGFQGQNGSEDGSAEGQSPFGGPMGHPGFQGPNGSEGGSAEGQSPFGGPMGRHGFQGPNGSEDGSAEGQSPFGMENPDGGNGNRRENGSAGMPPADETGNETPAASPEENGRL